MSLFSYTVALAKMSEPERERARALDRLIAMTAAEYGYPPSPYRRPRT